MNKKPTLKKLTPSFGSSIMVKQHVDNLDRNEAYWHFHKELELIYINKGQGKTHIGNHLSYFNNSQLILIGEYLPHNGFTDRLTATGTETTIHFKTDFLELAQDFEIDLSKTDSFAIYICVEGNATVSNAHGSASLQMGETVLIPAETKKFNLNTKGVKLLQVTI